MIKIHEAPDMKESSGIKIFLAGGITNCPDWQSEIISKIKNVIPNNVNFDIYNPRRKNFPINDPDAAEEQIKWEYNKLKESDLIIFWFSKGSLNPIVIYELGMWGNSRKKAIIVGIDHEYPRTKDVVIQTKLARPDINIVYSINDIINKVFGD